MAREKRNKEPKVLYFSGSAFGQEIFTSPTPRAFLDRQERFTRYRILDHYGRCKREQLPNHPEAEMNLQALYYTEMAFISLEHYIDTDNPFYLDVASDFFEIAFRFAPEA